MKKLWEQIKKFYDGYKIVIFIVPLFGGAVCDRFVNLWNVSGRLDADEKLFIETRKRDSIMYMNDKIKDSIRFYEIEKQLKQKTNEQLTLANSQTNFSRRGKR